jgi:putative NADH-flavin reductase
MRILLYGASGLLGQRLLAEAVERGHEVTAASPAPSRIQERPGVTLRRADVLDPDAVAALAEAHDVLLSAVGPGHAGDPCFPVAVACALIEAARRGGIRLVVVGEMASPDAAPGLQPAVTLDFATTWSGDARAVGDALELYRAAPASVDWTYVTPGGPVGLAPRRESDQQAADQPASEQSLSQVSVEAIATAILDELEQPAHRRRQLTVPLEREPTRRGGPA